MAPLPVPVSEALAGSRSHGAQGEGRPWGTYPAGGREVSNAAHGTGPQPGVWRGRPQVLRGGGVPFWKRDGMCRAQRIEKLGSGTGECVPRPVSTRPVRSGHPGLALNMARGHGASEAGPGTGWKDRAAPWVTPPSRFRGGPQRSHSQAGRVHPLVLRRGHRPAAGQHRPAGAQLLRPHGRADGGQVGARVLSHCPSQFRSVLDVYVISLAALEIQDFRRNGRGSKRLKE